MRRLSPQPGELSLQEGILRRFSRLASFGLWMAESRCRTSEATIG